MKFCTGLAVICVLALVAGCATQPAEPRPLQLVYDSKLKPIQRADDVVQPCIWISDARRQTSFYGYDISEADTIQWLRDGITNRFDATSMQAVANPSKGMHVMVTRSYVNPHAQALTGVVVLRVVWGPNDQVYRGQVTRTNWWGSDSELQNVMTEALDRALGKFTLPIGRSQCEANGTPDIVREIDS